MMPIPRPTLLVRTAIVLAALVPFTSAQGQTRQSPDSTSDSTVVTTPQADAEVLLWTIRTQDVDYGARFQTTQEHHVRIRILTARGASELGTVSLPMLESAKLTNVEARTISPDGTTRVVVPREIHDQVLLRTRDFRVRTRSFAFPGVVTGSILDYAFATPATTHLCCCARAS